MRVFWSVRPRRNWTIRTQACSCTNFHLKKHYSIWRTFCSICDMTFIVCMHLHKMTKEQEGKGTNIEIKLKHKITKFTKSFSILFPSWEAEDDEPVHLSTWKSKQRNLVQRPLKDIERVIHLSIERFHKNNPFVNREILPLFLCQDKKCELWFQREFYERTIAENVIFWVFGQIRVRYLVIKHHVTGGRGWGQNDENGDMKIGENVAYRRWRHYKQIKSNNIGLQYEILTSLPDYLYYNQNQKKLFSHFISIVPEW